MLLLFVVTGYKYGAKWGDERVMWNISINFDSNDRVRRIGSVQMSYNRFALERVGG
jgi:hypothetical protein